MPALATIPPGVASIPPARRPELVIRPLGDRGRYVVKDPCTGAFYSFAEQEHFLLTQHDGERDAAAICRAFQERFCEPLSEGDLAEFLELSRAQGFLRPDPAPAAERVVSQGGLSHCGRTDNRVSLLGPGAVAPASPQSRLRPRQSLLFWRKSLFDPDHLFTRLE